MDTKTIRALFSEYSVGLACVGLLGFFGIAASCGKPGAKPAERTTAKVKVVILQEGQGNYALGLTGSEPVFMGLGVKGGDYEIPSMKLNVGENNLELPLRKALEFRSRILTYRVDPDSRIHYFVAESTHVETLPDNAESIALSFPGWRELNPVNIYGSAIADGALAGNWEVVARDPYTGARIDMPGASDVSHTDNNGVFAFRFLFAGPDTNPERKLTLDFSSPDGRKITKIVSLPSAPAAGVNAGYLNLTSPETVMLGKSTDDYDGDGYLNLAEDMMGTNPFAVNLNGCIPASQVLKGFAYTCPNGARLVGEFAATQGLNCWDIVGDVTGDGIKDAKDCALAYKGEKGDPGTQGAQGNAGTQGSNGSSAIILVGNEAAGGNCTYGGKQITTCIDTSTPTGSCTISDQNYSVQYVCNGADSSTTQLPPAGYLEEGSQQMIARQIYLSNGSSPLAYWGWMGGFLSRTDPMTSNYYVNSQQISHPITNALGWQNSDCTGNRFIAVEATATPVPSDIFAGTDGWYRMEPKPTATATSAPTPIIIKSLSTGKHRDLSANSGYCVATSNNITSIELVAGSPSEIYVTFSNNDGVIKAQLPASNTAANWNGITWTRRNAIESPGWWDNWQQIKISSTNAIFSSGGSLYTAPLSLSAIATPTYVRSAYAIGARENLVVANVSSYPSHIAASSDSGVTFFPTPGASPAPGFVTNGTINSIEITSSHCYFATSYEGLVRLPIVDCTAPSAATPVPLNTGLPTTDLYDSNIFKTAADEIFIWNKNWNSIYLFDSNTTLFTPYLAWNNDSSALKYCQIGSDYKIKGAQATTNFIHAIVGSCYARVDRGNGAILYKRVEEIGLNRLGSYQKYLMSSLGNTLVIGGDGLTISYDEGSTFVPISPYGRQANWNANHYLPMPISVDDIPFPLPFYGILK